MALPVACPGGTSSVETWPTARGPAEPQPLAPGNRHEQRSLCIFLLCGLPFAGKSTMGRALSERFGLAHVEVDRYMRESIEQGVEPTPSVWLPAYRLAMEEIRRCLDAGRSAVFDAVGHRRKHRERMRRLATRHGAELTVIYLDVGADEARARMVANRANPARPNVSDEGFAWIAGEMEPPAPDEAPLVYRPSEPLAAWLERAIAPLLEGGQG